MPAKLTHDEFCERVKSIHGSSIEILGEYKSVENLLLFYCTTCKTEFSRKPPKLRGCPICIKKVANEKLSITHDEYIERVKTISEGIEVVGKYKNTKTPIEHRHKPCLTKWLAAPSNILNGTGCPECGDNKRRLSCRKPDKYTNRLKEKFKGKLVLINDYETMNTPSIHQCTDCLRRFVIPPHDVLKLTNPCSICAIKGVSAISLKWFSEIENKIKLKIQTGINGNEFKIKSKNRWYKVDGYNKRYNVVFEFHGDYYHGKLGTDYYDGNKYKYTLNRTNWILKVGYPIVYIWESDYKEDLPPTCLLTQENAHYKEWAESHGFIVRMVERAVRRI